MQKVFTLIRKVAPTETTVLIQGESGTGKELAARALHLLSPRARKPLISVNCAAIPESLIESELFGHEKGAFTGAVSARTGLIEAADGGSLFLDEIGELPAEAQARLLRVLQESEIRKVGSTQSRTVDVRMIAATHRNLKAMTRTGEFREDLYYRLNVMQIRIPPLRERRADILGLARRFLKRQASKLGRPELSLSPEAMQALERYRWPGNVRELENAIERASILTDGDVITPAVLDLDSDSADEYIPETLVEGNNEQTPARDVDSSNDLSLEDYFQHFVLENQDRMSETELAQKLGISRKSLWERRQRLGIPRKKA
jgi:DNA-binding NtrC family response regulator